MAIEIRRTAPDELRAAASTVRIALLDAPPDDAAWATYEPRWSTLRSFSAWEGDRCVGHVASFDTATLVPGGAVVPTVGVSSVGVLPTHTRRGVFTDLMDALHADAAADGAVLASLRASEATIYERQGYGMAGTALTATIDAARALPLRGAAPDGTIELVPADRVLDVTREVYARATHRPGRVDRPDWLSDRYFEKALTGTDLERVALHRAADGTVDGYVHYELEWSDSKFDPGHGSGKVHEVWATGPAVELALWQYVLGIPLVRRLNVDELAPDSVLFGAAADSRAVKVNMVWDEQWVRLLDVGAALAARAWADARPVVVGVRDERFGVEGRWRLGADGAAPTTDDPDVVTDLAGVSATYLGSTSWWDLVATGRATESRPGGAARADAVAAHRPLAFCGSFF